MEDFVHYLVIRMSQWAYIVLRNLSTVNPLLLCLIVFKVLYVYKIGIQKS